MKMNCKHPHVLQYSDCFASAHNGRSAVRLRHISGSREHNNVSYRKGAPPELLIVPFSSIQCLDLYTIDRLRHKQGQEFSCSGLGAE